MVNRSNRIHPPQCIRNFDDFVKSPTSALRFISQALRRTVSTPRAAKLARLEFGAFTKSSVDRIFTNPSILEKN
jgi:hypothetical protein